MTRDDPDPDRHLWVVPPVETYERMTADELRESIESLKKRNDDGWASTQARLAEKSRKRKTTE